MSRTSLALIGLFSLICISCFNFEFGDKNQVYPKSEFDKILEIEIYSYINEKKSRVIDSAEIKNFVNFFKDSSNYFKNELVKFNGVKSTYSIGFISSSDTLDFQIYPTEFDNKLEMGFFEPVDPGADKWAWRNFNRFYVNAKLLDLIDNATE